MNHTSTTKNLAIVAVLAAITAALTGTIAITIQTAAAYNTNSTDPNSSNNNNNSTDIENSGTHFKFKEREKNNCSGDSTNCCNIASQIVVDLSRGIIVPLSVTPVPLCPIEG
jgi:hypothetical protein